MQLIAIGENIIILSNLTFLLFVGICIVCCFSMFVIFCLQTMLTVTLACVVNYEMCVTCMIIEMSVN